MGTLTVHVLQAKDLASRDIIGENDDFCAISVGKQKQRTKTLPNAGANPAWEDEVHTFQVKNPDDIPILVEAWDEDPTTDDLIGGTRFQPGEVVQAAKKGGGLWRAWHQLFEKSLWGKDSHRR
jgi:Ca2+-dependent lipid-binding protein